jgi:exosortase
MATVTGLMPGQASAKGRVLSWAAIAWFTVLLIVVYFPVFQHLVVQWSSDEDVGHGFFVIPVAAYMVWQRRERLLEFEWKPAWWGVAIMLWGVFQSIIGTLGAELFLQRTSILITLVGLLLVFGGTRLVKELAFPLTMLLFMIPIPTVVFNQITFPLQLFASRVAEVTLGLIGIPVLRDGNVLELASQKLSVAEACSGIRSLLSMSFLALVYAYFFDKKVWMRWALLIGTLPLVILANAGRVTVTGILSEFDPELAGGFFHSAEGFVIFGIDFVMLIALHALINRFYKWKFQQGSSVA